jgi:preprotein translocase subunit SecG
VSPGLWFLAGFITCLAVIVVVLLALLIFMGPADGDDAYGSFMR